MEAQQHTPEQVDPSKVPCCKCKDEVGIQLYAVHKVSKTEKNKDRPFYTCSLGKQGCGFFCWVDDVVVDERTGLAKRKYIPPPDGYVKKPKITSSSSAVEELEKRIDLLTETVKEMKERMMKLLCETKEEDECVKSQKTVKSRKTK